MPRWPGGPTRSWSACPAEGWLGAGWRRGPTAPSIARGMEPIDERVDALLAQRPEWLWDGESLPVPVEDVVDSVYGLLIREVDDLLTAPGAPALEPGETL